jgi:hypothetical protein
MHSNISCLAIFSSSEEFSVKKCKHATALGGLYGKFQVARGQYRLFKPPPPPTDLFLAQIHTAPRKKKNQVSSHTQQENLKVEF